MKEYELWNSEIETETVTAESDNAVRIEAYQTENGRLKIYLNHMGILDRNCYTVQIGNEVLEVQDVSTVKTMGEGVTYVCIVDNSGSLDDTRAEQIRQFLTELNQNKKDMDSICLIFAGSEVEKYEYRTDEKEIQQDIDAIRPEDAWTNLYKGIDVAVQSLTTSKDAENKKCIVILSDGAEESENGITLEEAYDDIEESHVPVYTVALISDQTELERAKLLGSFARKSGGGKHFTPFLEGTAMGQVSDEIRSDMEEGTVLMADVDTLQEQGRFLTLEVSCQTEAAVYRDTVIDIDRAWISHAQEATGTDAGEMMTETATETGTEKSGDSAVTPIFVGGLVCIGIFVIVLVLLKMRQKTHAQAEGDCETNTDTEINEIASEPQEQEDKQESVKVETVAVCSNHQWKKPDSETFHIQMVRLGNENDGGIEFDIQDVATIGRDSQNTITIAKDVRLSGRHCQFTKNGDCLYLEDLHSTNGTYLNGVPIKQPMKLEQDDVILIGSYEYRIQYKKK